MSLGAAFALTLLTIFVAFALVLVMAGVESRMFDDVMVTPEADADLAPAPAALEAAPELRAAA